jgi:hypothetical protein
MKKTSVFVPAILIILLLAVIALPSFMKARKQSQRNVCANNLSQIAKACTYYLVSSPCLYPDNFLSVTNYVSNPKVFVCPLTGRKPGLLQEIDSWSDYVLVTNLRASSRSDFVLAYCRPENHKEEGGINVVFVDGTVRWVTTDNFGTLPCDVVVHSRYNKNPQPIVGGDRAHPPPQR